MKLKNRFQFSVASLFVITVITANELSILKYSPIADELFSVNVVNVVSVFSLRPCIDMANVNGSALSI